MTITAKVDFKEYVKLVFTLTYKKPVMIVIVCVGLAMLTWVVGYALGFSFLPEPQFYQYTTIALILVVQPCMIFLTIRRTFISSNHLGESLRIAFDPEKISLTGAAFHTEFAWAGTFKVVELPHWFMVYQNTISAVLAPKRSFAPGEIEELKRMLKKVPGLKLHLQHPRG